jgi:hypothetical protein
VLTVALDRPEKLEALGFFLNRHLKLSEVSAIDESLPLTIQEIPAQEALRDYFPAVDAAQRPSYAMASYYQFKLPAQGRPGEAPLRLRVVYHGVIDDPPPPPASPHTGRLALTTGYIEARGTYLAGATFWVPQRPEELFTFTLRTIVGCGVGLDRRPRLGGCGHGPGLRATGESVGCG